MQPTTYCANCGSHKPSAGGALFRGRFRCSKCAGQARKHLAESPAHKRARHNSARREYQRGHVAPFTGA